MIGCFSAAIFLPINTNSVQSDLKWLEFPAARYEIEKLPAICGNG